MLLSILFFASMTATIVYVVRDERETLAPIARDVFREFRKIFRRGG
jgi:hypothetical protein